MLGMTHNSIGSRGLTALLPVIQHRLQNLVLGYCSLNDSDVALLISALMQSDRMNSCTCLANIEVQRERH
jgi:hypothetical protein